MLLDKLRYLSSGADFVVLAGSLPRGVDPGFYGELIRELSRRQVPTVLDSEGEPLRLGLEAEPFLVSPNQREAEALVGQEFYERQDFALALEHIAELGARNVLITNESGCFARLREGRKTRRYRAIAPQVEAVSTVGSGDVLLAAFIAAHARRALARGGAARRGRRRSGVDARGRRRPLRPEGGGGAPPGRRGRRPRARRGLAARPPACDRELALTGETCRFPRVEPRSRTTLVSHGEAAAGRGRQCRPRRREPAGLGVKLFSLEGLELGRIEVERLLALEEKFAREGLTFDDVLLVPGRVRGAPERRLDAHAADPRASSSRSRSSPRRWTPSPRRGSRSRSRVSAGIGVVHRNLSIDDQVGRGRQGEALRGRDDRRAGDAPARRARLRGARADGALPHLRRARSPTRTGSSSGS